MKFIFFTKTEWKEAPRLRHQLANLLSNAGHEIIFFERPVYFWQSANASQSGCNNISLYKSKQLIHHKLRIHHSLHWLNSRYEKRSIFLRLGPIGIEDVVVNFNYDYYFLKDLFPGNRIITIINDNFWSRAFFGWESPLKWALKRTCVSSCHVLTVSPPLVNILRSYCSPQLFLPWADGNSGRIRSSVFRTELLYWGYIGDRIDWQRVFSLAEHFSINGSSFRLIFVGPHNSNDKNIRRLLKFPSVVFRGPTNIDQLNFNKTLGIFIPYKAGTKENDAIFMPNKLLQLLSKGLPVIITGMPHFLEASFVFRLPEKNYYSVQLLQLLKRKFELFQPEIYSFLNSHTGKARLDQFMRLVNYSAQASPDRSISDESCQSDRRELI
jgi:hypothetical protein